MKSKKKLLITALTAFILMFAVGGGLALRTYITVRAEQRALSDLAAIMYQGVDEAGAEAAAAGGDSSAVARAREESISEGLETLRSQNQDLFGWIVIDGTNVDYPVMSTPGDEEYYIHRDFDGEYSYSGLPFTAAVCTEKSDNILIYAHNMRDESMFGPVKGYENASYLSEHPTMRLYLPSGAGEYRIIAAFRTDVSSEAAFIYPRYAGTLSEEQFNEYLTKVGELSLYGPVEGVSYGTGLLTLSTCDTYTGDVRFVVVAARIG